MFYLKAIISTLTVPVKIFDECKYYTDQLGLPTFSFCKKTNKEFFSSSRSALLSQ